MNIWERIKQDWYCDTPCGRYHILRDKPGSRSFNLFLGKDKTKYYGTVDELKNTVEQIVYVYKMHNKEK